MASSDYNQTVTTGCKLSLLTPGMKRIHCEKAVHFEPSADHVDCPQLALRTHSGIDLKRSGGAM